MDTQKRIGVNAHNAFVKQAIGSKNFKDILSMALTPEQIEELDLNSIVPEVETYINKEGRERRVDIIISIRRKRNGEIGAKIIFLIEHKSYKDKRVLFQLLDYINSIYQKNRHGELGGKPIPVIPIILYHGEQKKYSGPLRFQDLFDLTGKEKKLFGEHIINFKAILLNMHSVDIEECEKDLRLPIFFYALKNIWRWNKNQIKGLEKIFTLGQHLSREERTRQINLAIGYIREIHQDFTFKVFYDIECEVTPNEEDRVVELFQLREERVKEEGREEGIKKGREEGREEGREKGREEVAIKMLKSNLKEEDILLFTGLAKKELRRLKKELGLP